MEIYHIEADSLVIPVWEMAYALPPVAPEGERTGIAVNLIGYAAEVRRAYRAWCDEPDGVALLFPNGWALVFDAYAHNSVDYVRQCYPEGHTRRGGPTVCTMHPTDGDDLLRILRDVAEREAMA